MSLFDELVDAALKNKQDLDFTGGADFTRDQLAAMGHVLVESLKAKYGLEINVTEPVREEGNVDTWKLKVQTRPGRKDLPAQRINKVKKLRSVGHRMVTSATDQARV